MNRNSCLLNAEKNSFQKLFHRNNKNTPNFPYFTNDFQNNEKCEKNAPFLAVVAVDTAENELRKE